MRIRTRTSIGYSELFIMMVLGTISMATAGCKRNAGSSSANAAETTETTFDVQGMHCATCPIYRANCGCHHKLRVQSNTSRAMTKAELPASGIAFGAATASCVRNWRIRVSS